MIIPVRCFSCGHVIGHLWESYDKAVNELDVTIDIENPEDKKAIEEAVKQEDKAKIGELMLNELGVKRYCCRRMFVSHVELIDDIAPFSVTRVKE